MALSRVRRLYDGSLDLGRVYCRYTFRREAFAFVFNAIGCPTTIPPSKCREILSRSGYFDVRFGFGRVYCQYAFRRENLRIEMLVLLQRNGWDSLSTAVEEHT